MLKALTGKSESLCTLLGIFYSILRDAIGMHLHLQAHQDNYLIG
jgi:hypothetical protein